jgi:hypothetical protein
MQRFSVPIVSYAGVVPHGTKTRVVPIPSPKAETAALNLLREAVGFRAEHFESHEDVSGAELVEWFSEWRLRASKVLGNADRDECARKMPDEYPS